MLRHGAALLATDTSAASMQAEAYLTRAFRRPDEVLTPSGADPDGAGSYKRFDGGFNATLHYPEAFVWHSTSRPRMRTHLD
jgi:hypothetical protein